MTSVVLSVAPVSVLFLPVKAAAVGVFCLFLLMLKVTFSGSGWSAVASRSPSYHWWTDPDECPDAQSANFHCNLRAGLWRRFMEKKSLKTHNMQHKQHLKESLSSVMCFFRPYLITDKWFHYFLLYSVMLLVASDVFPSSCLCKISGKGENKKECVQTVQHYLCVRLGVDQMIVVVLSLRRVSMWWCGLVREQQTVSGFNVCVLEIFAEILQVKLCI